MSEWREYTGSDEQIDEMRQSMQGFVARNEDVDSSIIKVIFNQVFIDGRKDPIIPELFPTTLKSWLDAAGTTHYLICNQHPLAKDFIQWINTGQPVWWRSINGGGTGLCHEYFPPFAHPDAFEYSFTEFKEEV